MNMVFSAASAVESPAYRKYIPVHTELFATRVRSVLLNLTFDLSCLGYKTSPCFNRKQLQVPHGVLTRAGAAALHISASWRCLTACMQLRQPGEGGFG